MGTVCFAYRAPHILIQLRCRSLSIWVLFKWHVRRCKMQQPIKGLVLPEKEVIQSHLPVRLPCYDFTPVTSPAFGIPLLAVKVTTSGIASSHSVTDGVYMARERIHRHMADRRLLAISASCRRVAAYNPN